MNIYTCTYFKQQTVIRLATIFTQVRLALAMIQVNASAIYTCRSSTLISQQERVEDDAEYEITGSKMTRNMKLP